jgi:hypothetical protein
LRLRWYADAFSERSKIVVDIDMASDIERSGKDLEIAIFRVVQECLTNVHRHLGSRSATLRMVRELLGREEIHVAEAPSDSPAMSIGKTTPQFLSACCRLLDLLDSPQDTPFLSGLIQREIIYRVLRGRVGARLRAVATLGDQSHRTAKAIAWIAANYAKPLHVEDLAQIASMGVSRSATKALRNSIANTAASSAKLLCETFERIFLRVLRNSNWSVASESGYSRSCCVHSQWSANRKLARKLVFEEIAPTVSACACPVSSSAAWRALRVTCWRLA